MVNWVKKGTRNFKSRLLFLIQYTHQVSKFDPFLAQNFVCDICTENLAKIRANVQKCWSRYHSVVIFCRPWWEKLKIAMLNEAGFMLKLRFESWNWSKRWLFLFFLIFTKGIKAKLNTLESEVDISLQMRGKVDQSELTPFNGP